MNSEQTQELNRRLVRYVLPENWQIKFKKTDDGIICSLVKENMSNLFKKLNAEFLIEKNHESYTTFLELLNAIERDAYGSSEIYLSR